MFLFILLVYSLHSQLLSSGAPIAPNPDTGVSLAEETPQFNTNYRSTIQIIWTCASVIFASTWVCVHPHVPGYRQGRKERWGLRGRHFVNALLWPDQAVAQAFKEWMGARKLHARMVGKRMQLDKKCAGLAGETETELKRLAKEMMALLEEVRRPQEDVQVKDEEKRLSDEDRWLDPGWRKLGSILATLTEGGPPQAGEMEVGVAQSVELVGAEGLKPGSVGDSEQKPLQVGVAGMDNPRESLKQGSPGDDYWTIVHAHFIQMGGVIFEGANGAMWYKEFDDWSEDNVKAFFALRLSKEDIEDRSKADALSKAFVIVQCLWFVIQCIGRRASNLPLTELEVTCLAYIACNVAMYAFWWDKPLNVACPVLVTTTENPPPPAEPPRPTKIGKRLFRILQTLSFGDIGLIVAPSRGNDNTISDSLAERYPVNYYYGTSSDLTRSLAYLAPLAVFGALHTIAWYAEFPSTIERLLWRGSSVTPAILAVITFSFLLTVDHLDGLAAMLVVVPAVLVPVSLIACFAARLAFLVLPALQLRSLPPLAYQTIPWSGFLPHV